jgi:predicted component of viral defense system (DUF524 family)
METTYHAEIECRAADGAKVATVILTLDMPDVARVEIAPLIVLTAEAAAENGESVFQLRENGRYYYDVAKLEGDGRDLRLRCDLARRRRDLKSTAPDAGRVETGNFCGTLLLEIVEGDAGDKCKPALATALVDVRSVKLDYRSDYRGMLRDIAGRMADLVADARSSAKTAFRSNFEERNDEGWFQVQLELLREVLEGAEFQAAMQRILAFPHERLEQELEEKPVERPLRWTPRAMRSLVHSPLRRALPDAHPLAQRTRLTSIAARVPVMRRTPTADTPENRFIRHALRDFHGFLSRAQRVFEGAGGDWSAAAGLARRLLLNLEQWLSRPFFKEVDDLEIIPLGSPVLQRRAGYREMLHWWLRFRTAAELSWDAHKDLFHAGQRNVSELYEYWLFFALLEWFCDKFANGARPPLEKLLDGLDGDAPRLRVKKRVPLGPFTGKFAETRRTLHASFSYNRKFQVTEDRGEPGSWTRDMHPDYTLTFWPALKGMTEEEAEREAETQELLAHIHLDAKYRVDNLAGLFGEHGSDDADEEDNASPGNYKRQDLLKMHAYRDAIKRSEGAYVLYPGDADCRLRQFKDTAEGAGRWPDTMRGFHEILPGLGAFAIAPDENGKAQGLDHLAQFLDEVLDNLCNRASLRERRAANLHESLRERRSLYAAGDTDETGASMLQDSPELDADKLRVPAAPDIMVLVGWFDSPEEKKWMLDNGKVVLRLGDRRGSLPLIKSLAAASHVLMHGRGKDTVPGLKRILPEAGRVLSRSEVVAEGFPTDPTKDPDHIFAVFSVAKDADFTELRWDSDNLNKALVRFQNRQRPAYKSQLKKLTHEFAKPQLVSLADLQLALATSA